VVTGLAAAWAVTHHPVFYLLAVAATLPCGVIAWVGVYLGYALLQGVGGLFWSPTDAAGDQAVWLAWASATLNVGLVVAAGLGNVSVVRTVSTRMACSSSARSPCAAEPRPSQCAR
jgi:hypothetical protein